mmetsp:Transcript_14718/g.46204  ORF Transcript_14718/g.46204 Transcript_14718/m.46204 type:complete len:200 (+) Transcript_14718:50-649(+)
MATPTIVFYSLQKTDWGNKHVNAAMDSFENSKDFILESVDDVDALGLVTKMKGHCDQGHERFILVCHGSGVLGVALGKERWNTQDIHRQIGRQNEVATSFYEGAHEVGVKHLMMLSCHFGQLKGINFAATLPDLYCIKSEYGLKFRDFAKIARILVESPIDWRFVREMESTTADQHIQNVLKRRGGIALDADCEEFHVL